MAKVCGSDGDCPADVTYLVTPSIAVDFTESFIANVQELSLANEPSAEGEVKAEFSPLPGTGTHCVLSVTQFAPLAGAPVGEAEGVIARMDAAPARAACPTAGVRVLDIDLRPSTGWGCGGQPQVTLVDAGELLPEDAMHLTVGACAFDAVLVPIRNGRPDLASTGLLPPTDTVGYHVVAMARPASGSFRLVWVPLGGQQTSDLDYTPAAVSPPYSFPAGLSG